MKNVKIKELTRELNVKRMSFPAKLVIGFTLELDKMDLPEIDHEIYSKAYRSKPFYKTLRDDGVDITCNTLIYVPRIDGTKMYKVNDLLGMIQTWENDCQKSIEDRCKERQLILRFRKHNLNLFFPSESDTQKPENFDLIGTVSPITPEHRTCGGLNKDFTWSKYAKPMDGWDYSHYITISEKVRKTDLKNLDRVEKKVFDIYNQKMNLRMVDDTVSKKLDVQVQKLVKGIEYPKYYVYISEEKNIVHIDFTGYNYDSLTQKFSNNRETKTYEIPVKNVDKAMEMVKNLDLELIYTILFNMSRGYMNKYISICQERKIEKSKLVRCQHEQAKKYWSDLIEQININLDDMGDFILEYA